MADTARVVNRPFNRDYSTCEKCVQNNRGHWCVRNVTGSKASICIVGSTFDKAELLCQGGKVYESYDNCQKLKSIQKSAAVMDPLLNTCSLVILI